jgi:hypothetical protein
VQLLSTDLRRADDAETLELNLQRVARETAIRWYGSRAYSVLFLENDVDVADSRRSLERLAPYVSALS